MCGIVGFLDSGLAGAEAAAVLARMRAAIRHRGPDDDGQFIAQGVGLGVQRLSIIDLASGHQPMASADGRVNLVFNGEIYNHAALRAELRAAGRVFQTHSDTEVVLAVYERFGLAGVHKLNGMFAVAIWDGRAQELHLVRDRMGVKPLYYFSDGKRFYFASEIKALIKSGRINTAPNRQAVWDYLTFRYVPAPETIWTGIFKVPPAHTLTLTPGKPIAATRRYWDMPYALEEENTVSTQAAFPALFRDAVAIRMLADVPVGVFLSGGLDSSAVAASVDRTRHPDLKTFSVAMEDSGADDEREFARCVAQHLATDHHEIVVTAQDFISSLSEFPFLTDEPLADATCLPLHFLAKAAREQVKVVLSGEGADEILAGYSFDAVVQGWDTAARAQGISVADFADQRKADVPLHITNYLDSLDKRALFKGGASFPDSVEVLRRAVRRTRATHPLHQSLYLYCQNWLVEDLLMKADKMTMAASLELRTPFLDYRLVEWAARAPVEAKVRRAADGAYVTKAALRDYARIVLPREIVERPKKGFPVPVYNWMSGRLRPFVQEMLYDPGLKCAAWLEPGAVRQLAARGTETGASIVERHNVWHLLVLELWARAWLP